MFIENYISVFDLMKMLDDSDCECVIEDGQLAKITHKNMPLPSFLDSDTHTQIIRKIST